MSEPLEKKVYFAYLNYTIVNLISSGILTYFFIYFLFLNGSLSVYCSKESMLCTILAIIFFAFALPGVVVVFRPKQLVENYEIWYKKYIPLIAFGSFICLISLIVTFLIFNPTVEFKNDLASSVKSGKDTGRLKLDYIQKNKQCCGYSNYSDYLQLSKASLNLPASCCSKLDNENKCTEDKVFQRGCYEVYENELSYFKKFALIIIGILLYTHLETIALYYLFVRKNEAMTKSL